MRDESDFGENSKPNLVTESDTKQTNGVLKGHRDQKSTAHIWIAENSIIHIRIKYQ